MIIALIKIISCILQPAFQVLVFLVQQPLDPHEQTLEKILVTLACHINYHPDMIVIHVYRSSDENKKAHPHSNVLLI